MKPTTFLRRTAGATLLALAFTTAPPARSEYPSLQDEVIGWAHWVAHEINSTGGYRFDGSNDCYGFVRRLWNPTLDQLERPRLPVGDYRPWEPSPDWAPIETYDDLLPGDVLSTHQGHAWGDTWHGGIYFARDKGYDEIMDSSWGRGVTIRPAWQFRFRYYYIPTHELLRASTEARVGPTEARLPEAS